MCTAQLLHPRRGRQDAVWQGQEDGERLIAPPSYANSLLTCTLYATQYSGKVGGRNDDLIIALQLAITGIRCFYQDARYDGFRPVNNETVVVPRQM